MTPDIAQRDLLELVPDPFIWVQGWGVPRQLLHGDLLGRSRRQAPLAGRVAVDRGTIPDKQPLVAQVAQQMVQAAHDICALERARLHRSQQLPMPRAPADHRAVIPRQRHIPARRVPPRCVGAHAPHHQGAPSFIYPDDNQGLEPQGYICRSEMSDDLG